MAKADYMLCYRCYRQAYYDADTDYRRSLVTALCKECKKDWMVVLKPQPKEVAPDFREGEINRDLGSMLEEIAQLDRSFDVTPGPWFIVTYRESHPRIWGAYDDKNDLAHMVTQPTMSLGNAKFIALSRTAMPALAQAVRAVLSVLDNYEIPGKLHDPTGIAAELETLDQYIREAIQDALGGDDA